MDGANTAAGQGANAAGAMTESEDEDLLPLPPLPPPRKKKKKKKKKDERPLFAADEAARFKKKSSCWCRGAVRLRVGASPIHGKGLFAACEMQAGDRIGRFWGRVVHRSANATECEEVGQALRQDRLALLRDAGEWCLVDMRGCVFEWSNCCEDSGDAPMRVTEGGWVETTRHVSSGEELVWDYDRASFRL